MKTNGVPLDGTVATLREALTRASRRAAAAAANLANVDTPGYRAVEVVFDDALARAGGVRLERTERNHLPSLAAPEEGVVREAPALRVRADGNSVDVDVEMNRLARTQGRFQAAAEMVRKRLALLAYAASDGRNGS